MVYSAAHGPYGDIQKTWANTYDPKLKFSGKERESYSNYDYFGARYYDHFSHRFLSPDPLRNKDEALTNPQLWNLYSYCNNNPIAYFDPDGRLKRKKDGTLKFRPSGISNRTHKDAPGISFRSRVGFLFADDGTAIKAFRNLSGDTRSDTDCHGLTFADGEYWIDNPEVEKILKGDNYIEASTPEVGNIVIYYDSTGKIVHYLSGFLSYHFYF